MSGFKAGSLVAARAIISHDAEYVFTGRRLRR